MSLGAEHTLILKRDSTIWAAGANLFGQLGIDTETHKMVTSFVKILSGGAKDVAAGGGHSMVLKQDGSVWSTGRNTFGQLGDGSKTDRHSFVKVVPSYAQAVAAGAEHSLAIMRDGSMWATGLNMQGQLGDGTTTNRDVFVKVMYNGAAAAAAGREHSLVLKQDGSVWIVGGNDRNIPKNLYMQVISSGAKAVAAGGFYSMVLKQDGTVWAAGENSSGQLGDGSVKFQKEFVQVIFSGAKSMAAGYDSSIVLKEDGSVWTTGNNNFGQLGDMSKSTKFRSNFAEVIPSGVQAVATGNWHSMVVKQDGTLWATGANAYGQLGDDYTVAKREFVRVLLPSDGTRY